MEDSLSLQALPTWFAVLPDTDAAAAVAAKALAHAAQTLRHRSGRPWLVGRWAPSSMVVGECGGTRLAVLGEHSVSAEAARRAAAAAEGTSLSALDRIRAASSA